MAQYFRYLQNFSREEDAQDMIEYSLLITFVAIACAAIVGTSGSATTPVWSAANSDLTSANSIAASSSR